MILHDTQAEDTGKAGADKKSEVETDGLVTPDEKVEVGGLPDIGDVYSIVYVFLGGILVVISMLLETEKYRKNSKK